MGSLVNLRKRWTSFSASSGNSLRAPVIPVLETAYTKPVETSAIRFRRASVLVGAARNTVADFVCVCSAGIVSFLYRQVGDERAIDSGLGSFRGKLFHPHAQNRIEVGKDNQSGIRFVPNFSRHFQTS